MLIELLSPTPPRVDRKYRCAVVHKGEVIAEAVADSLKNAKNMAALKALRTLGISN